jgi:predicted DNA-binding transcriptional regulator AlpA
VAAKVDPDDLIDTHEIAALLGLSSPRAVSVYRSRYATFPQPLIDRGTGRCLLWLRADVETWAKGRK